MNAQLADHEAAPTAASVLRRAETARVYEVAQRTALERAALLSERLGAAQGDGSIRMTHLTHEMLSQYVGTSRELVTKHMNEFRRQGYVTYSRRAILLHRHALSSVFDENISPASSAAR